MGPIEPSVLISAMSSSRNVGCSVNWANGVQVWGPCSETKTSAIRLWNRTCRTYSRSGCVGVWHHPAGVGGFAS